MELEALIKEQDIYPQLHIKITMSYLFLSVISPLFAWEPTTDSLSLLPIGILAKRNTENLSISKDFNSRGTLFKEVNLGNHTKEPHLRGSYLD